MSDVNEVRQLSELPALASNVLNGNQPVVRIIVEGQTGNGKSAILLLIHELLKEKGVKTLLADAYTHDEMKINSDTPENLDKVLKMYSPVVVLQEKLIPKV